MAGKDQARGVGLRHHRRTCDFVAWPERAAVADRCVQPLTPVKDLLHLSLAGHGSVALRLRKPWWRKVFRAQAKCPEVDELWNDIEVERVQPVVL